MPRLPTGPEITARFTEYVRFIDGECVDDLIPPQPSSPKKADYLLLDRRYVAEFKCITTNHWSTDRHRSRLLNVLRKGMAEGHYGPQHEIGRRALPSGQQAIRYRLDETSNPRVRAAFLNAMARPMRHVFADASKQIRSTAAHFGLTAFHGVLIVMNLADQQLTPDNMYWVTTRLINEHPETMDYVAFYSPHIGGRLPDGRKASLWMTMIRDGASKEGCHAVTKLMDGWMDFNRGSYLDLESM